MRNDIDRIFAGNYKENETQTNPQTILTLGTSLVSGLSDNIRSSSKTCN